MSTKGYVAGIFHHIGQQFLEDRGVHIIDFFISFPDFQGFYSISLGKGIKSMFELAAYQLAHALEIFSDWFGVFFFGNGNGPPGDILAQIANALQIAGDANGTNQLAQILSHGLAQGNHPDGVFLNIKVQLVDFFIDKYGFLCKIRISLAHGRQRITEDCFAIAAHSSDHCINLTQLLVI